MGHHQFTRPRPGARSGFAASHRRPRARLGVVVAIGAAVVAAGLLVVVVRSASASSVVKAPKGITAAVAALAAKWAKARGLPLAWVLATIKVESGGNPNAVGDAGGRSVGLMQVNSVAHADWLKSQGLNRSSLFHPDTNIMVGTKLLREAYDTVVNALSGRTAPANIGVLTRLAYKGPNPIANSLKKGNNPAKNDPQGVASWNAALAETAALV